MASAQPAHRRLKTRRQQRESKGDPRGIGTQNNCDECSVYTSEQSTRIERNECGSFTDAQCIGTPHPPSGSYEKRGQMCLKHSWGANKLNVSGRMNRSLCPRDGHNGHTCASPLPGSERVRRFFWSASAWRPQGS